MFPCLDYPLNVLITWIRQLSSYNWFCHICERITHITWCCTSCSCMYPHDTIFDICFSDLILSIHMCLLVHATWHSFYHSLGSFLTLLDLNVQIPKLELKQTPRRGPSLPCEASWPTVVSFLPVTPYSVRGFSLEACERPFVLFILCKTYFCVSEWCNMFVILCRISMITLYM